MKILVIGGMHGNEPLGQEVVRLFQDKPVKGVDVLLANEKAIEANCRFVKNDLNRSFPGDSDSADYETKRAAEILQKTKGYDLVLDFHNTHCPDNDCGFVGDTAPQQLSDISAWLGLKRVIVADYDCINKYATNCLSVEISLNSNMMDADTWYERISELAQVKAVAKSNDIQKYRFVYRMTLDDKERLDLPNKNLRAFSPIAPELAKAMDVVSPAYPIFIGDGYTPYNYGGLLNELQK
jgi:hypothetical protein